MSKDKKPKQTEISPEKMAILAEQGLKAARLTKEEKEYLLHGGLKELYDIWEFAEESIPSLETETIDEIMNKFFPPLRIRILEKVIEIIKLPSGLHMGSTAFAVRGKDAQSISFHKMVGRRTVHVQITGRDERLADIHVRLTDDSGKGLSAFQVELFKGKKCIETVSTTKSTIVSLSALEIGDYKLRLSDSKGEITSIALRIEK